MSRARPVECSRFMLAAGGNVKHHGASPWSLLPLADEHERGPVERGAIFFAGDHGELRSTNRVGWRRVWSQQALIKVGHQFSCRFIRDRPQRHTDRGCARVHERSAQTDHAFATLYLTKSRLACRKHHQRRAKLEIEDFTCPQIAVVVALVSHQRQHQTTKLWSHSVEYAVRSNVKYPIALDVASFQISLVGAQVEPQISLRAGRFSQPSNLFSFDPGSG